jgi:hypothetical protein
MADLDIRDTVTGVQSPARGTGEALHIDASPLMVAVTQHDSTDQDPILNGVRFDAYGTVSLESDGVTHALNVIPGEYLAGRVDRINSTGTSLTNAQMIGFTRG